MGMAVDAFQAELIGNASKKGRSGGAMLLRRSLTRSTRRFSSIPAKATYARQRVRDAFKIAPSPLLWRFEYAEVTSNDASFGNSDDKATHVYYQGIQTASVGNPAGMTFFVRADGAECMRRVLKNERVLELARTVSYHCRRCREAGPETKAVSRPPIVAIVTMERSLTARRN